MQRGDFQDSDLIDVTECPQRSLSQRLVENAVHLFTPLV
jgi:hypothetical protein